MGKFHANSRRQLLHINSLDPELTTKIVDLPWVQDGITEVENMGIHALRKLIDLIPKAGTLIVGYAWQQDELTGTEAWTAELWAKAAETDRALVEQVFDNIPIGEESTVNEAHLLYQLAKLSSEDLTLVRILLEETEGFEREEQAVRLFVLAMSRNVSQFGLLHDDIRESLVLRRSVLTLPLAGDVNLWAIRPDPFPQGGDYVIEAMTDAVRELEELTQVPFPVTDVILVIPLAGPDKDHGIRAAHYGSFFTAPHYTDRRDNISIGHVQHEVGHYLFRGNLPLWLVEGTATFMRPYVEYKVGRETQSQRIPLYEEQVERDCSVLGLRTIQKLNELDGLHGCHYSLGAYFLLRLWEVLGEDSLGKALGEIYLHSQEVDGRPTEEEILDILLDSIPPEQHEDFYAIYHELHTAEDAPAQTLPER